jgi:hypothetical protein
MNDVNVIPAKAGIQLKNPVVAYPFNSLYTSSFKISISAVAV